jgi:hypothetical protein
MVVLKRSTTFDNTMPNSPIMTASPRTPQDQIIRSDVLPPTPKAPRRARQTKFSEDIEAAIDLSFLDLNDFQPKN